MSGPLFSSDNIITNVFKPAIGNKQITKNDLSADYHDDAVKNSWRYKAVSEGLYSTQQLEIDWSKFQEHTFFHSAEVKVNAAYERVINHYPYDGSESEKLEFFDGLNGFESFIYLSLIHI